MADTIMDPEIYKQLGELNGRFNTFEKNMSNQFNELKQAIKDQQVVPYAVFAKHVEDSDAIIAEYKLTAKDHETRLETIETALKLDKASLTGRIAAFLDNAAVKVVGTAVIFAIIFFVYLGYQEQIDALNNKLYNIQQEQQP